MKINNPFRRKDVPSNGRRQAWVDDTDKSLPSTQSVLDTILGCLKPSRSSNQNVYSSSSNDFSAEDVSKLSVNTKNKKKKKKKKSRKRSGKKRVTSGNRKSRSRSSWSKGVRNLHSKILRMGGTEVDSSRSGTPHNLEYIQSATPVSSPLPPMYNTGAAGPSLNLIPHFMKRNRRKVGCDMYYADSSSTSVRVAPKNIFLKKTKHEIIKAEQDDSNVIGSTPLPRQTPEMAISAAMSNDPRITTNSPSSFDTERVLLESPNIPAREPVNFPSHNETDRTKVLSSRASFSSNCWESVLREMADNSAVKDKTSTGLSSKEVDESTKPCSEIDTAWLTAMGDVGAFNGGSKSLKMVKTEEKPVADIMSYEERKEARKKYCLLIQEQRENINRLQKRQQNVHGNMEELTNIISRVKRSVGRCMDITSTYEVELKITSLNQKHSAAKEDLYVLENEINQRMLKVKDLGSNIAQLKLLDDAEDDAMTTDIFEEVNEVRNARPLGAHGSRIRSRTENMQRYLPYSYTQRESASDEEKRKTGSMDVQNVLDNACKHLERHSCGPSYSGTHCIPKVEEEEDSDDEFAI